LGLALREAGECRRCGGDLAETTDYDYSWKPAPPVVCLRCVALSASEKSHAEHTARAGMIHQVTKSVRPKPKPKRG
jgi:hypothetical protein